MQVSQGEIEVCNTSLQSHSAGYNDMSNPSPLSQIGKTCSIPATDDHLQSFNVLKQSISGSMATNTEKMEVEVHGMTCAACVGRVERSLKQIPGVLQANVNLATERAHVLIPSHDPTLASKIIQAIEQVGYEAKLIAPLATDPQPANRIPHTQLPIPTTETNDFKKLRRDWLISLVFALPIFLLSMGPMLYSPWMNSMMQIMTMQQWNLLLWALATPVQFGPGWRFYRNAFYSLKSWSPDMNLLVALGTSAAYFFSSLITFFPNALDNRALHVTFESSAVVICLVLLGKLLESRSKQTTKDAIQSMAKLQPATALRLISENNQSSTQQANLEQVNLEQVSVNDLQIGDRVEIREGQSVPIDGLIEFGQSYLDESMVTGEPIPKEKGPGDRLIGGTLNGNGTLIMRVTAVGAETFLARITALVAQAQSDKPPIQSTLDQIIRYFAPAVVALAILTALGWLSLSHENQLSNALIHSVAVLVVACPCALGLATPMSMMVGSGRGAELGILFRSQETIQKLANVQTIVLDKTGTLTAGKPLFQGAWSLKNDPNATTDQELLELASLAARNSNHPIALAIRDAAKSPKPASLNPTSHKPIGLVMESQAVPGRGIQVRLSDLRRLYLGSYPWMQKLELTSTASDDLEKELASKGFSLSWLAVNNTLIGALAVLDPIKDESPKCISTLKALGIHCELLSGDHPQSVANAAKTLKIDAWQGGQLPQDKAKRIDAIRATGKAVAFVGDGINDAPALAAADVGIAMGNGTEIAMNTADVVLANNYTMKIPEAIALAQAVMRNIYQNLFWAFAYNLVLLPLAAGWLSPWTSWTFTPMMAALAMSFSSILVVGNALRLRRFQSNDNAIDS
jgi:Cu+-exporting ATPase